MYAITGLKIAVLRLCVCVSVYGRCSICGSVYPLLAVISCGIMPWHSNEVASIVLLSAILAIPFT